MADRFVGSQIWRELLGVPSRFVPFDTIRQLNEDDFADLVREYAEGSGPAAHVAFQILRTVATRRNELPDVPWTSSIQAAFVRELAELGRSHFVEHRPWPRASGDATGYLWARLDPTGCGEFLVAQSLLPATEPQLEEAIRILASLSGEYVMCRQRLQAMVDAGGDSAVRARDALEDVGVITPERLEAWGRRWRETHAPDALNWLYDHWLSFLPVGFRVQDLMAVLGPPDEGQLPDLYYRLPEGHVYVEAYADSGFSGCHRT